MLKRLNGKFKHLEADLKDLIDTQPEPEEIRSNIPKLGATLGSLLEAFNELTLYGKERADLIASLVYNSPSSIFVFDDTGQCVLVNEAGLTSFGVTEEKALKFNYKQGLNEWSKTGLDKVADRVLKTGKFEKLTFETTTSWGKFICADTWVSRFKSFDRHYILIVQRDITEQVQFEKQLIAAKAYWEQTFDSMDDLIMVLDCHNGILRANKAAARILGKQPRELIGNRCYNLIHNMDEPPEFCVCEEVARSKDKVCRDIYEPNLKGIYEVCASPLFGSQGEMIGCVHVARDISKRVKSRQLLEQANQRLKIASELSTDLIYEWCPLEQKIEWHGNIEEALGLETELPRTEAAWLELIHPDDRPLLEEAVELHQHSQSPINYEYRMKHTDGSWRWWSDKASPILGDDDQPLLWVGVCSDITCRKKLEEMAEACS